MFKDFFDKVSFCFLSGDFSGEGDEQEEGEYADDGVNSEKEIVEVGEDSELVDGGISRFAGLAV